MTLFFQNKRGGGGLLQKSISKKIPEKNFCNFKNGLYII